MCGFAVYFSHKEFNPNEFFSICQQFLDKRGPDFQKRLCFNNKFGNGAMYHSRLSIVDCDNPAANQPYETAKSILVFNGEVYNYKFIKQNKYKGYSWQTNSDTEVLAKLIEDSDFSEYLGISGIYSFASLSKVNNYIYFGNDVFNTKPIYYCKSEYDFCVSSDPRLIAQYKRKKIKRRAILETACFGYIGGNDTPFHDITKPEPGRIYQINLDNLTLQPTSKYCHSLKTSADSVLKSLSDETISQIPDIPFNICLSGGVDSTFLYYIYKKHPKYLLSINVHNAKTKQSDENENISQICSNDPKVKKVLINSEVFYEHLTDAIRSLHTPVTDTAIAAFNLVCAETKKRKVKVLFSGCGGDEMFNAYPRYRKKTRIFFYKLASHLSKIKIIPNNVSCYILRWFHPALDMRFSTIGNHQIFGKLKKEDKNELIKKIICRTFNYPKDLLPIKNVFNLSDCNEYLPNLLLRSTDNISMQHGVECRVPLCDIATKILIEKSNQAINTKQMLVEFINNNDSKLCFNKKDGFGMRNLINDCRTKFLNFLRISKSFKLYFNDVIEIENASSDELYDLFCICYWLDVNNYAEV